MHPVSPRGRRVPPTTRRSQRLRGSSCTRALLWLPAALLLCFATTTVVAQDAAGDPGSPAGTPETASAPPAAADTAEAETAEKASDALATADKVDLLAPSTSISLTDLDLLLLPLRLEALEPIVEAWLGLR